MGRGADIDTYVLIPGAATGPWYWDLVAARLRERGHEVIAVELPCDDDEAGLGDYADAVVSAVGDRDRLIVVGHSLGGFTASLVCGLLPVDLLILVQAMVPVPGERPAEWWANTGHAAALDEQGGDGSLVATYFHDVPPSLAERAMSRARAQSATPMTDPWPLDAWPPVATRYLLCSRDRFFPAAFLRRVVASRLSLVPDEMSCGHLPMLSHPEELARRLEVYREEARSGL
jgi:pimeloyl-ACP methyl ester carboxylesterase